MKTPTVKSTDVNFTEIVKLLKNHSTLVVPTDTIYGICCLASSEKAVNKIYAIKGRDESKPLAICLSNIDQIGKYTKLEDIRHTGFRNLFSELLPGPFTFVLNRSLHLPHFLNPKNATIGIRIPDDNFMIDLCGQVEQKLGMCIALTSANLSGHKSCISVNELKPKFCDFFSEIIKFNLCLRLLQTLI
ncbi:hypothetical protein ACOME3_003709 [Neoechinorhynchus agilis]